MLKICHWEITKRCNLSCIHCISSVGTQRELDTKQALKVIDNLDSLGCKELYITGGEPLIRKDIFKILEKAKEKKFKIGLFTNGTLIDHRNIKKIKFYVNEIGISLDGSNSKINDKIRGIGTFKKIIKAISIIKNNKIPFGLYTTLTKINFNDFENIFKLVALLGIDFLRINEVSLRGRAYKNRKLLKITKSKEINFREYLLEVLKKNFSQNSEKILISNYCEINSETIFLSPLGYIYPCIEIFQRNPNYHFGNILKYTPKTFEKYQKTISSFIKNKCPYQFIGGENFAICLNNSSIKCSLGEHAK